MFTLNLAKLQRPRVGRRLIARPQLVRQFDTAHGLTLVLAACYARRLRSAPPDAPELVEVQEVQVRRDVLLSASRHMSGDESGS